MFEIRLPWCAATGLIPTHLNIRVHIRRRKIFAPKMHLERFREINSKLRHGRAMFQITNAILTPFLHCSRLCRSPGSHARTMKGMKKKKKYQTIKKLETNKLRVAISKPEHCGIKQKTIANRLVAAAKFGSFGNLNLSWKENYSNFIRKRINATKRRKS